MKRIQQHKMGDMDNISVHTPTKSELNTFKVMANLEFVDLKRPPPTSSNLAPVPESFDIFPDEAARSRSDSLDRSVTPVRSPPRSPPRSVHTPARSVSAESKRSAVSSKASKTSKTSRRSSSSKKGWRVPASSAADPFWEQAKKMTNAEIVAEKEGLLMELQMLEKQGIYKPTRLYSMSDTIEELQFQVDRANSNYGAQQAVDFAKTGIRVGSTLLEMLFKWLNINALDNFSGNLCKDMNKFNRPLTRMYRKYWRRGGISSPETELLMIVLGSMAMTVVQNKNLGGIASSFMKPSSSSSSAPAAAVPKVPFSIPGMPMPSAFQAPPQASFANSAIKPPVIPGASWNVPAPTAQSVPPEAFARVISVGETPRKKKASDALVL